jgi:hypothetical protein
MRRLAEDSREADLLFGSQKPEISADIAVSWIVVPRRLKDGCNSALSEEFILP